MAIDLLMKFRLLQILFFLSLLLIGGMAYHANDWSYLWWWIPLSAIYGGILAWGVSNIRSGLFISSLSSARTANALALTFDDGPHPNTPEVLAVLKKFNVPATFFCIGKNVEQHPQILQQVLSEGHTIGNHTQNHLIKWGWLSTQKVTSEIEACNISIKKHSGVEPLLFRPPFGVTNPNIGRALKRSRMQVIGWDLRSLDTAIKDQEKLFKRIKKRLKGSSIILFHDSQEHTPAVLERTLEQCQQNGIKVVSLGELLQIRTYA